MKKKRTNTRTYRFKMQPTWKQGELFAQFFGCARFIYNGGLGLKIERYKTAKNIRDVALRAESENSPSESGEMVETIERTWRESTMNPTKRQDNKSYEAQ